MKNKNLSKTRKNLKGANLDTLLEEISVMFPGMWDNENTPTLGDWYAVSTDLGIIAYFGTEADAFSFRKNQITMYLLSDKNTKLLKGNKLAFKS